MSLSEVRRRFNRIGRIPDPLGYVFLGLSLLSLGAALLAWTTGALSPHDAAALAATLLGAVLIADAAVRYRKPWTRHRAKPYVAIGACLIAAAAAETLGAPWWVPLPAIAGLALAAYGAIRASQRAPEKPHSPQTRPLEAMPAPK